MERLLLVDLVVGPLGGLELLLDGADVPLREPVALLVGALRPGAAVMRTLLPVDLPSRDVILGVGMVVELLDCDAKLGGQLQVAGQLPVGAESRRSFGSAPEDL